jgi:hypothetical protein
METADTLFGRALKLSESIPEDEIHMHPDTWLRIRPIAYRNAVVVQVENKSQESRNAD